MQIPCLAFSGVKVGIQLSWLASVSRPTFSFRSFFSRFFSFLRSLILLRFPSFSLRFSFLRRDPRSPSLETDELETDLSCFLLSFLSRDLERDLERCFRLRSLDLEREREFEGDLDSRRRWRLRGGLLLRRRSGDLERDRGRAERSDLCTSRLLESILWGALSLSAYRLGDLERDLEECSLSLGMLVVKTDVWEIKCSHLGRLPNRSPL